MADGGSAKDQFDALANMLDDIYNETFTIGDAPAPAAPRAPVIPAPYAPAAAPAGEAKADSLDAWMKIVAETPGEEPKASGGDDSSANDGDDAASHDGELPAETEMTKGNEDGAAIFGEDLAGTGAEGLSSAPTSVQPATDEQSDYNDAASDDDDGPPPPLAADGAREACYKEEVVQRGSLGKKGEYRWNDRWFVLTTEKLMYTDKKDGPVKGSILASDFVRVYNTDDAKEVSKKKNAFGLVTPQRTYFFCTATDGARAEWVAGFQRVIAVQTERSKAARESATITRDLRVGYMRKKQNTGRWPRRLFVLSLEALSYYDQRRTKLRGVVSLSALTAVEPDSTQGKEHCLMLQGPHRTLFVTCANATEYDDWRRMLEGVIHRRPAERGPRGPVTGPAPRDIKFSSVLKIRDGEYIGTRLVILTDDALYLADKKNKANIRARVSTTDIVSVEANDTGERPRFGFKLTLLNTSIKLYAEDHEALSRWVTELRRACIVPPFPESPYDCWRIWRAAYERGQMAVFCAYKAGGHSTKFTFDKLLEIGLPSLTDLILPPPPEAFTYLKDNTEVTMDLADRRTVDTATGKPLTGTITLVKRPDGPGWQCVSESWTRVVAFIQARRKQTTA